MPAKRRNITLPQPLEDQMLAVAATEQVSFSAAVQMAIRDFLRARTAKPPTSDPMQAPVPAGFTGRPYVESKEDS